MPFMSKNFDLPENIFYFHNIDLQPLSFVLDWDSKDKFYYNLLNSSFADVFDEPNEHAMVLVKPEKTTYCHSHIPAFDIRYIEDCFKLKDYPDPNQYLIKNSCPIRYSTNDIYICWYHKTKTWSDLTPVSEFDDDQNESRQVQYHISSSNDDDSNQSTSTKVEHVSSAHSSKLQNKKTRMPFSLNEDIAIVKFIAKHNYASRITGREIWQKMEHSNVCKIRTWQSMKERYLKHIKWDLYSKSIKFSFLSSHELEMLQQGFGNSTIGNHKTKNGKKFKLQAQDINDYDSDDS